MSSLRLTGERSFQVGLSRMARPVAPISPRSNADAPITADPDHPATDMARRDELLERAYDYVLERGLADFSLRPLAAAVGSSPRVLLFLFGSKDDYVLALLARARADELALVSQIRMQARDEFDLAAMAAAIWRWLAAEEHRDCCGCGSRATRSRWIQQSPWASFAERTVKDWLDLLAQAQPPGQRRTSAARAQRTLILAGLRGALLDLLATDDPPRRGLRAPCNS